MLTLRIENFDQLPDGGPIAFQVDRRGFDVGRAQHLDWTLPDPTRCISSKHCEVRFVDGAYWLYDVSTNGTFVNRSSRRVQSPYRLADGDQLEIGDYIISVSVEGEEPVQADVPEPEPAASEDLWNSPTGVAPPIDPRELLPPIEQNSRAADFLSRVVDMPTPSEPSNPPIPGPPVQRAPVASPRAAPPPPQDPWAPTGLHRPPRTAADHAAPRLATGQVPFNQAPLDRGYDQAAHQSVAPAAAHRPAVPAAAPERPVAPAVERGAGEREFLRQFALGANLPSDTFLGQRGEEFAYELGVLIRIASANLMQLLNARAAAKTLARSTERTMIQQSDNNPLKFMPSAEEAVRVMLSGKSPSYLDGRQSFERGFADLQVHQMATYTAMQQALQALLDDLDPQSVASAAGSSKPSLLGSSKAKAWEAFCARWEAKAGQYEHGMLDAFLMLFSEFYDRASRQRR